MSTHRRSRAALAALAAGCWLAAAVSPIRAQTATGNINGYVRDNSGSVVPTVGASGAISGVLGGYLILFPRNRVYVMTWGGVAAVPAVMMLGLWILLQFVNGFGSVAATPETGGVAYIAHIGGFFAGMGLLLLVRPRSATGFR